MCWAHGRNKGAEWPRGVRKSVTGEFGAEHVMCFEFSQVHFDHCVEMRMKGTGLKAGGQSGSRCDYQSCGWYLLVFLRTSRC